MKTLRSGLEIYRLMCCGIKMTKRSYFSKKKLLYIIYFIGSIGFATCSSKASTNGYSLFMKDGLYGIISENREIVMQPNYDYVSINSNSIICSKGRTKEIYNTSLELLYSSKDTWGNLKFYTDNEILIRESMSGKARLLNVSTGKITDFKGNAKYNSEEGYRDNVGLVWEKSKVSFLYSIANMRGKIILTDIEQAHSVFSNGMLAVIMTDGKSGFVNKKGEMLIETSFYIEPDDIGPRKTPVIRYFFKDNYSLVKNAEKKWVQYSLKGEKKSFPDNIIPADYCYENGLVPILNKETMKYGYMNHDFEIIIPCEFDEAHGFCGQYAIVKYKNEEAIVDMGGHVYFSKDISGSAGAGKNS